MVKRSPRYVRLSRAKLNNRQPVANYSGIARYCLCLFACYPLRLCRMPYAIECRQLVKAL